MARWMIWARCYAAVPVIGNAIGAEDDERTRREHIFNGLRAPEARNTEKRCQGSRNAALTALITAVCDLLTYIPGRGRDT